MSAILQLALDFVDLHRAVRVAEQAVPAGVDWVEAGTPLIKSEGLDAVRELKRLFPGKTIVADMKIMDAGRIEVESAAKAGAGIIDVLGTATDATIEECIQAGKNYGAKIAVDLIAVADPVARARAGGGPGGRLHLGARGHRRADAGPGPLCHPLRREPGGARARGGGRGHQLRDRGRGRGPRGRLCHRRRRHHQGPGPGGRHPGDPPGPG